MSRANILGIDTAGPVIGVALLSGGEIRQRTERIRRGAEARLVPWAEELCREREIALGDLDGIAVTVGPGAFTGLRVGLATAIGLATALNLPVVGASSLETRAGDSADLVLLDARKQRVYAGRFRDGRCVHGPVDVPPAEALSGCEAPFVAVGEGALVYRELVEAAGGTVPEHAADPGLVVLVRLGAEAIARGEGLDVSQLRPVYVREPDAKKPTAQ